MFAQNHRFRAIAVRILALLCACVFLLAPATPTHTCSQAYFPTQRLGNRGTDVQAIPYLLRISPSGVFDSATSDAVRKVQQAWGLTQDRIVGPVTWSRLIVTLRYGNSGNPVRAVHILLSEKRNAGLLVNGIFDTYTDRAVRAFESHVGLNPDGVMDLETWKTLIWHDERIDFSRPRVLCPL